MPRQLFLPSRVPYRWCRGSGRVGHRGRACGHARGNAKSAPRALRRTGQSLQGGPRPDERRALRISRRCRRPPKSCTKASIDQRQWFPKGTGPEAGKTRALPEIWSKPEDFVAAQKMFSERAPKLLAAAKAKDVDCREGRIQGTRRRLQELPRHVPLARRIGDGGRCAAIPGARSRLGCAGSPGSLAHGAGRRHLVVDRRDRAHGMAPLRGYTMLALVVFRDLLGFLRQLDGAVQRSSCADRARSRAISRAVGSRCPATIRSAR